MSSKPFVEKEKPDFTIYVNDCPILCIKAKCNALSELISEYLSNNPKDPNSFHIAIPYVTVEREYSLVQKVFNKSPEESFEITEPNSRFFYQISKTFKIKSLETSVDNYLNDKIIISRSFEKDEQCFLLTKIEAILVNLTKKTFSDDLKKIDTILILQPNESNEKENYKIDKFSFCRIFLDVITGCIEKADLYIEFIEKLRDSQKIIETFNDIFIEKIQEKNERILSFEQQNQNKSHRHANEFHSFYLSQSFCFALRKFIKKKWFNIEQIREFDFFSPIMADCVPNLNRYKLTLLFHNYSENIERMKANNWKYHNMYCNIGHNEDPLMAIFRKDDLEGFKSVVKSIKKYKFSRPAYHSAFERCDFVNHDCEIIEYAAFFGAVKCFEFIYENLEIIPKELTRYAIAGGFKEIVKICEMKSLTFYNCLDVAIQFHHWNLLEYLCENKSQNIMNEKLLEDTFASSNYRSLLLLLGKGINFRKFFVWSLKYKQHIFANFYLSLDLKSNYLNEYDEQTGMTAIHFACLHGYDSIVMTLINKKGINLNLLSKKEKMSLLHYCCINGSKNICEEILNHNEVDINLTNKNGMTPLHFACENGFVEIADLLLKREEIKVNIKSNENKTPLILACERGSLDIYQRIMSRGDEIVFDRNGDISILQASCSSTNLDLVKEAAKKTVQDFSYYTPTTMTALSNACSKGNLDIVKYLIEEREVDYNQAKLIGQIPLNLACKNGQEEIAFYLFGLPKIIKTGQSLVLATDSNHINIIKKILSYNENEFPFVDFGLEALCIACRKGLVDIVELLVNSDKVELNPKSDKMGPLHFACLYGYPDIVRILINNPKVDINLFSTEEVDANLMFKPDKIKNSHHMSPLHFAIKGCNNEVAKLLLEDPRIDVNAKAHGIFFFLIFFYL